jgi:hypothetical protein
MATLLVYGWYGRQNVGDELFKPAFQKLFFPHGVELKFVDYIDGDALKGTSGVVFGGGSMLVDDPNVTPGAAELLLKGKPSAYYVGIGTETTVGPLHQKLLASSPVVAYRDQDVPDLAYVLDAFEDDKRASGPAPEKNGLLVVPNVEVVPTWADAHWVHVAWEHYKNELAQVLDEVVDAGVPLNFMAMCANERKNDERVAREIVNRMTNRASYHVYVPGDGATAARLMRAHKAVLTQRYHGIVLAEMSGVSYVSVDHHDKLRLAQPHRGLHCSYHGVQKHVLASLIDQALNTTLEPSVPPLLPLVKVIDRIVWHIKQQEASGG